MLNVFILVMTETTSRGSFDHVLPGYTRLDHDSSNVPTDANNLHCETCFIRDQNKHVPASCEHGIRKTA